MKAIHRVGCCAILALSLCYSSESVGADEAQTPTEAVAQSPPTLCQCAGETSAAIVKINRALGQPLPSTGLDFTNEPLENVVNFLQDEYDIPIQLDVPALEDAGLTADEPLTVNIQHVSLRSGLRLLLKPKQLTYIIADEVLIITTPEEAEAELTTCVYDVRDLVGRDRDNREIKALVNVIVSCVASQSWAMHKGGIAQIQILRPGLLVIAQTRAVHEEIADLLSVIRAMLRQPVNAPRGQGRGMMMREGEMDGMGMEGGYRGEYGGRGYGGEEGGYGRGYRGGYGGRGEMMGEPTPGEENPFD